MFLWFPNFILKIMTWASTFSSAKVNSGINSVNYTFVSYFTTSKRVVITLIYY
jgi:hypothetical protein